MSRDAFKRVSAFFTLSHDVDADVSPSGFRSARHTRRRRFPTPFGALYQNNTGGFKLFGKNLVCNAIFIIIFLHFFNAFSSCKDINYFIINQTFIKIIHQVGRFSFTKLAVFHSPSWPIFIHQVGRFLFTKLAGFCSKKLYL